MKRSLRHLNVSEVKEIRRSEKRCRKFLVITSWDCELTFIGMSLIPGGKFVCERFSRKLGKSEIIAIKCNRPTRKWQREVHCHWPKLQILCFPARLPDINIVNILPSVVKQNLCCDSCVHHNKCQSTSDGCAISGRGKNRIDSKVETVLVKFYFPWNIQLISSRDLHTGFDEVTNWVCMWNAQGKIWNCKTALCSRYGQQLDLCYDGEIGKHRKMERRTHLRHVKLRCEEISEENQSKP